MKVPLAIVCAVLVASLVGSCSKDKRKETKLRRDRDQAAVVIVDNPEASGAYEDELEPNDDASEIQDLGAASGVTGMLDGSADLDFYRFETKKEGMLFLALDGAPDADLKLELRDEEGAVLAQSDRGPAKTAEGVAGFPVSADQAYQILVSEFTKRRLRKKGGRQGPSERYRLQIAVRDEPERGYEVEANEELEGAMEVVAGDERYGYIGWRGDADLWRLPVTGFGNVRVGSSDEDAPVKEGLHVVVSGVKGVPTNLQLLAGDNTLIAERSASKGQEVAIRNFVPEVSAEFYLIRISSKYSNPEESYVLSVESAELPRGTEEEPNDTFETATPLSDDAVALVLASGEVCLGDVDMFGIPPASEERVLELRLRGPDEADLDVAVVTQSGAVLAASELESVGANERLQGVPVAAGTSPLVRVRARTLLGPARYELSLTLVPGTAPSVPASVPAPGAGGE